MRLNCTVTISSVLFLSSFQNGSIKKDPMQPLAGIRLLNTSGLKLFLKRVSLHIQDNSCDSMNDDLTTVHF